MLEDGTTLQWNRSRNDDNLAITVRLLQHIYCMEPRTNNTLLPGNHNSDGTIPALSIPNPIPIPLTVDRFQFQHKIMSSIPIPGGVDSNSDSGIYRFHLEKLNRIVLLVKN